FLWWERKPVSLFAEAYRRLEFGGDLAADDDRDAAVAGVERLVGKPEVVVGKAAHGAQLAGTQPLLHHDTSRGVRAIDRQLPVAVPFAARVGTAVGVPFDHDVVLELGNLLRDHREQLDALAAKDAAAGVEEARPGAFDQLD